MPFVADLPDDAWERRDDPEMHEIIVLAHWELVCLVAGKMRQSLPDHVEEDDLRQYGVFGLMRAIRHFDPTKGFPFSTYATNAIRGVILDELRSLDWAPRSLRKRQRDLAKAERTLKQSLGRDPGMSELAEELKWTVSDVQTTRRQVETSLPRSLDELRGSREQNLYATVAAEEEEVEEQIVGSPHDDRSTALTRSISEYIAELPEFEKSVVVFRHYLGLSPEEIATSLGVPPARVREISEEIEGRVLERLEALLKRPPG